jgi:acetyltransferase-like isoleucine patch superfamily enzyme
MDRVRHSARVLRALVGLRKIRHGRRPAFARGAPILEGTIEVGDALMVYSGPQFRTRLWTGENGVLRLGDRAFLNEGVLLLAVREITIGNDVRIGPQALIADSDFHPVVPNLQTRTAPIRIGNNVWIGTRALILPGADVGDHSVVAAGSVVTRPVPPRCVVAGNPASVVREFECPDDWTR